MKISGNGQAKILSTFELQALFERGFKCERDRALFAICFFSACRISEALQLLFKSITANRIVFCKAITKGKERNARNDNNFRATTLSRSLPYPETPQSLLFPWLQGSYKTESSSQDSQGSL